VCVCVVRLVGRRSVSAAQTRGVFGYSCVQADDEVFNRTCVCVCVGSLGGNLGTFGVVFG
jgi:hypothetical protein